MRMKAGECVTGLAPVSLVLTVLDSSRDLTELLDSISRQQILPAELLIVDRGSTDGTLDLLRGWQPPYGTMFKVVEAPRVSRSEARNLAIETASFDHIAITEGSVRLHTEWLARLWDVLDDGADVVAGVVRPAGSTLVERAIGAIETRRPLEIDTSRYLPPSTCLAFSKTIWDFAGGYPEWLEAGEDPVFAVALRHAGADIRFAPGAVASWSPPGSLRSYLEQSYRVARATGVAGVMAQAPATRVVGVLLGLVVAVSVRRRDLARTTAALALAAHLQGPLRRVWATRYAGRDSLRWRLMVTTGVALLSDVAKVSGYTAGIAGSLRTDESRLRRSRVDR